MLCSGTTTCEGLVLDVDSGKVLAQASAPHAFVEGLPRGHVESSKENQALYAELRGRHGDLTRKLASSGYL